MVYVRLINEDKSINIGPYQFVRIEGDRVFGVNCGERITIACITDRNNYWHNHVFYKTIDIYYKEN